MSILVFGKLHQLKGRFLIVNNNIAADINNFFYRWLIWLNSECTKRPFLMDAIDKHKPLFKLLSDCVQLRHVPYPVDRLILSLIPNRPEILSSFWGKLIRNKNILRVIGVDDEVHIISAFNSIFFNTSNINQYYNQIGFILIAPIIYSDSKIKWCKQGILEILQLNDSPMSTIAQCQL